MGSFTAVAAVAPAVLVTGASLAVIHYLRRGRYQDLALVPWQSALLVGFATCPQLFAVWWFGLREPPPGLPNPADSHYFNFAQILPPGDGVLDETGTKRLAVGDRFPLLDAAGWLNGSAPPPAESESGLTVIDVWNEECPVCHEAAPGLLAIYEKYAARGVNFVGLTARNQGAAKVFVEQHDIKWPNGYGVKSLRECAPQVFIVDRNRQIVWYDQRLRYRHESDRLIRELEEAIDHELTTSIPSSSSAP